jgi:hypothetical protein
MYFQKFVCAAILLKLTFLVTRESPRGFKFLSNNLDKNANLNQVEQANDIRVAHPYTTVARWLADRLFLIGAVDVDVPLLSVRIVFFQAIEPENP